MSTGSRTCGCLAMVTALLNTKMRLPQTTARAGMP